MITLLRILLISIHILLSSILGIIFAFQPGYKLYFKLSKYFSGGILWLSGIKLKITGLNNFSPNETYVFVSNHSSQFDIVALQKSIPNRMAMIFKKELAKIPFFGWQLYLGPYVMIDRKNMERAMKSIEEAKIKMEKNNISIVVFAEGTRSKTGEVQQFKRGAFRLATKVGYPIVPVSISGSNKIMPKGTFKLRSGTIQIHFDKPVLSDNIEKREDEIELMKSVRDMIIKNHLYTEQNT